MNLRGSEFTIDGTPLNYLKPRRPFTITDRDVTLRGTLAGGQRFRFDLNAVRVNDDDFFSPNATLTVTLVGPVLRGDVNLDGVVDFFDIHPFIDLLAAQEFQDEADIDQNGVANFFDIQSFINILAGN